MTTQGNKVSEGKEKRSLNKIIQMLKKFRKKKNWKSTPLEPWGP